MSTIVYRVDRFNVSTTLDHLDRFKTNKRNMQRLMAGENSEQTGEKYTFATEEEANAFAKTRTFSLSSVQTYHGTIEVSCDYDIIAEVELDEDGDDIDYIDLGSYSFPTEEDILRECFPQDFEEEEEDDDDEEDEY